MSNVQSLLVAPRMGACNTSCDRILPENIRDEGGTQCHSVIQLPNPRSLCECPVLRPTPGPPQRTQRNTEEDKEDVRLPLCCSVLCGQKSRPLMTTCLSAGSDDPSCSWFSTWAARWQPCRRKSSAFICGKNLCRLIDLPEGITGGTRPCPPCPPRGFLRNNARSAHSRPSRNFMAASVRERTWSLL